MRRLEFEWNQKANLSGSFSMHFERIIKQEYSFIFRKIHLIPQFVIWNKFPVFSVFNHKVRI